MSLRDQWARFGESDLAIMVTPAVAILWLVSIVVLLVADQIRQSPPPPPTPAQIAAARPRMQAIWRRVYPRLVSRLPAEQPKPPELGAVWATRGGQVCGLVDEWHTGVDVMTQFYTIAERPMFREEDERSYVDQWSRCMDDPYVVLHNGTLATGSCAATAGRLACLTARSWRGPPRR